MPGRVRFPHGKYLKENNEKHYIVVDEVFPIVDLFEGALDEYCKDTQVHIKTLLILQHDSLLIRCALTSKVTT